MPSDGARRRLLVRMRREMMRMGMGVMARRRWRSMGLVRMRMRMGMGMGERGDIMAVILLDERLRTIAAVILVHVLREEVLLHVPGRCPWRMRMWIIQRVRMMMRQRMC